MKTPKSSKPQWDPIFIFMSSAPFKVVVGLIVLFILGYCLGHFVIPRLFPETSLHKGVGHAVPSFSGEKTAIKTTAKANPNEQNDASLPVLPASEWEWAGDKRNNESHDYDDPESERLQAEADVALSVAQESLDYAMPLLAERLNSMSATQQRRFLKEAKTRLYDYMPPELEQLIAKHPDLNIVDKGWQSFLAQLRTYGYEYQSSEGWEISEESDTSTYSKRSLLSESESVPKDKVEKRLPVPSQSPTVSSPETPNREGLSPERFDKPQQLIDQYGAEEGLRRLREMDPEAARRFESVPRGERGHRPSEPARDTSKDTDSTQ